MDYKRIYNELIERARNRHLDGYTEKHRIVPGCMGGTYVKNNVVRLTPEEHYLAHQLLAKIHPDHDGLVHAAIKMTRGRKGNKIYGWLRKRYIDVCRKRTGKNNSNYGRRWYHDPVTGEAGKYLEADAPASWARGRSKKENTCKICSKPINKYEVHCTEHIVKRDKSSKNKCKKCRRVIDWGKTYCSKSCGGYTVVSDQEIKDLIRKKYDANEILLKFQKDKKNHYRFYQRIISLGGSND